MEKSCGAIIFNEDKVLVVKQTSGFYGFPKGHVEIGETEKETAIREVKEETGLDIKIISDKRYTQSYIVKENVHKDVVFFIAKLENNNEKIDWRDKCIGKYFITYDFYDEEISIASYTFRNFLPFEIYFTSKEIAQKAIKTIGEYRIKKYYFDIEE